MKKLGVPTTGRHPSRQRSDMFSPHSISRFEHIGYLQFTDLLPDVVQKVCAMVP